MLFRAACRGLRRCHGSPLDGVSLDLDRSAKVAQGEHTDGYPQPQELYGHPQPQELYGQANLVHRVVFVIRGLNMMFIIEVVNTIGLSPDICT